MRTVFSLLIGLILSTSVAYSQLDLGIKLGYNSSLSLDTKKEELKAYDLKKINAEFGDSYHLGVFLRYSFNRFYFQPELLYLKQQDGYEFSLKNGSDHILTHLKYNMFELPLLVGFKILKSKNSSLNLYAGPRFNTKIDSSLKSKKNEEPEKNIKLKDLDAGFALGIGVDLRNFVFEARYNINRSMSDKDLFKDLPTSNFIFSVGYKIL